MRVQCCSVGKLAVAIWEEASKICCLAASVQTPGIILHTYHDYVQLYVENLARIAAHVGPCYEFLQV